MHTCLCTAANSTYTGYFFAKGSAAVSLVVSLETTGGQLLAEPQMLDFHGGDWTQIEFSLTTGAKGTECVGIAIGSDPNIDCGKV